MTSLRSQGETQNVQHSIARTVASRTRSPQSRTLGVCRRAETRHSSPPLTRSPCASPTLLRRRRTASQAPTGGSSRRVVAYFPLASGCHSLRRPGGGIWLPLAAPAGAHTSHTAHASPGRSAAGGPRTSSELPPSHSRSAARVHGLVSTSSTECASTAAVVDIYTTGLHTPAASLSTRSSWEDTAMAPPRACA